MVDHLNHRKHLNMDTSFIGYKINYCFKHLVNYRIDVSKIKRADHAEFALSRTTRLERKCF